MPAFDIEFLSTQETLAMCADRREAKRSIFEEWMQGDHVLVHLDSRQEGVNVPSNLKSNPALCLKLSHLFQGETKSTDEGIVSWLKFSGQYFECVLPWSSIWGLTNGEGENRVWAEDMPPELIKELASSKLKELKEKFLGKKSSPKTGTDSKVAKSPPADGRTRPSLKRVK